VDNGLIIKKMKKILFNQGFTGGPSSQISALNKAPPFIVPF
jgi:hypothetical protein